MRKIIALGFVCVAALSGCSFFSSQEVENGNFERAVSGSEAWLKDGMIALSRPIPEVSSIDAAVMLGFMPLPQASRVGPWVLIDTKKAELALMDGDSPVTVASGEGIDSLKPGQYQVLHKQRNALWYAPDQYFTERGLKVPPQGDKSRYLRGALGDFVVFINKDTPIYSGPIWTEEIGGVRLSDDEMSRLYYRMEVGVPIEVR
jgi:hypothetical protein